MKIGNGKCKHRIFKCIYHRFFTSFSSNLFGSHQRTNNMMECYNRNFAKDFSKEKPGLFEWCESLEKHANKRERNWRDAKSGSYTNGQKRKDVVWPKIPQDFEAFCPKKKRKRVG